MNRQDQAIALAVQIAQKEAELTKLREEFAQFVPVDGSRRARANPVALRVRAGEQVRGNAPEQVLEVMQNLAPQSARAKAIAAQLQDLDPKLVRSALIRLSKPSGPLEKVKRGIYRLRAAAEA